MEVPWLSPLDFEIGFRKSLRIWPNVSESESSETPGLSWFSIELSEAVFALGLVSF